MRGPSGLAQPVGFLGVGGAYDVRRTGQPAGGLGPLQLIERGSAGQIGLDHQHRGRGPVEAEVVHVVDGRDREPVHQLERDGREAGGRDARDPVACAVEGREEGQHGRARRRQRPEAEGGLGDDRRACPGCRSIRWVSE